MTPVYFDSYGIEAQFDGANWTDITPDVIGPFDGGYGIFGNGPLDRTGDVGELNFTLNNSETNSAGLTGYYSPGHPACRNGFDIGLPIRLQFTYQGIPVYKWRGMIPKGGIKVIPGAIGRKAVKVTARTWMNQAANHELQSPAFAQGKNINEIVDLILDNMAIQPAAVENGTPSDSFNAFDTVRSKTRALTEFAKVVLSEWSFIYETRDGLRVEGRYTRSTDGALASIPLSIELSDYLATEDGGLALLTEGGNNLVTEGGNHLTTEDCNYLASEDGDYLMTNEVGSVGLSDSQSDMDVEYGAHLYNRIKCTAYPRRVDSAATSVLFELGSTIELPSGETATVTGKYRDPDNVASQVSGIDMVNPPVSGTDYWMNTAADGLGSDLTADLVLNVVYGTNGVVYTIENTGGTNGYVYLQARGKGVYIYDAVNYMVEDEDSININGPCQLNVDMKYQDDPLAVSSFAPILLDQHKNPRNIVNWVEYIANRRAELMLAFLYCEPGMKVHLEESIAAVLSDFFIQGVKFRVKPGGVVTFRWHVRDAGFDSYNIWYWDVDDWDDPDKGWGL